MRVMRLPKWLCSLLTRHRLCIEWANYHDDLSGELCLCRRYGTTYKYGKLIALDSPWLSSEQINGT